MNKFTRTLIATLAVAALPLISIAADASSKVARTASTVTTQDGVELYYKDWGPKNGQVVMFSHGWPLNSDSWESQMQFLAEKGYRVIAHDRRGHGRSSQPWDGNDMDHYADDLSAVIKALKVKDVTLVGFSTGGGEVARYIGRHGTKLVKKAALISAVPPIMVKTEWIPMACLCRCTTAYAKRPTKTARNCTWTSPPAPSLVLTAKALNLHKA